MGEEGLNTSFLSLRCTLQLLNHSAFSCLENLTFQRQTQIAWSSSAAICPFTCLAWAASRATLPSVVIKLLVLAGFDKPLCSPARQQLLQFALGSRVVLGPVFWKGSRGGDSHRSVSSQQQGSELARTKVLWISRYRVVSAHAASQDPLKFQQWGWASQFSPQKEKHVQKPEASFFCLVSWCHIPG